MGTKNLVMLKTHTESINMCSVNDFVCENMLWALASLRVFFCNYVLSSLWLILRYIFRFQVEDRNKEQHVPPALADQIKWNQFQDYVIDGFTEELVNLLFQNSKDFYGGEGETESTVFEEATVSDVPEESKSREEETETSVLLEGDSDIHEYTKQREGQAEFSLLKEKDSDVTHEDGKEGEGEMEGSFYMETVSDAHEDIMKIGKHETESSVFMKGDSNVHQEETEEQLVVMDSDYVTMTSKYQFLSRKDMSGFIEEEPTNLTFSFREFYASPNVSAVSDNTLASTANIADKEFSELNSKEALVGLEEEGESVQEQITFTSNSTSDRFRFESDAFGGSDSDDDNNDDYFLYNDNSLPSDSDSESSSSSGLIWANSNNFDEILSSNNSCEGFESTSLKVTKEGRDEDVEETQFTCDVKVSHGLDSVDTEKAGSYHGEEAYKDSLERTEETMWEEKLDETNSDEEDEDDYEWEHDEVVEQLRLELRNARQGGLATILEEEEEEEEEKESPKFVEDLKPLKIEEKVEYKDHIVEIQKVYRSYAEKMRKLDILNYQTMHAIGLLQLKDPIKLILVPKSTVQGAKPLIPQNLWPRKAPKHISDPMLKFVDELHRDLELVYVGQVCLSWEILCWQHKKSQELKQYDSQWPHRYNLVAGEFQVFQVLMERFIENEPFQGPRIQNYVKNRCVIRKLLQVPVIKDDKMKDKKIIKWGEDDDAIESGRLEEIIKESVRVFWEFVRADKDYGNFILKASQQIGSDVKDPAISDLLVDIRTELHKKERKLKEILRSGNCIVRRMQKHHEHQVQLDHEGLLAQVGLRLISRVVNMKKLRKDQLTWCNEKLNRIKFVGRKIQMEPSFLLFPC